MNKTRSKIFEELDLKATNQRWSWCGKNENLKISVFTIWVDKEDNGTWLLHDDADNFLNKRLGAKEQEKVLQLSIENSYTVYGLIAEAVNPNDSPRLIKRLNDEHLIKLQLERKGQNIFAKKVGIVSFLDVIKKNKESIKEHGLLDLQNPPLGKNIADRASIFSTVFKRDKNVRNYVLKRAMGRCEYCGELGFELKGGRHYLETHHIISLASEGSDTIANVIALCANHHRQAHFGSNAEALEKEFIAILATLNA